MKLPPKIQARSLRSHITGFTLVEMMVSVWVFLIIFTGIMVALQIFGLRVYTLGATKLSATAGAVKVLNHIRDDIREAKTVYVGSFTNGGTFTQTAGASSPNIGNALEIFPITDQTPPYTIYYLDTSTATNYLKMATTTDGLNFTTVSLASYITNTIVFDAEDCRGNILTNNANNRIIRMELDFYQWEYPIGYVGGVNGLNAYDYYRLTTKVTRRQID
jgi:prepilin-type N-terminal cleavage/methylation domain-containing protein